VVTLLFCPPVALATYAAAIVGTHLTGLMNDIMVHPWAGQLEHLVYVLVGCQFFMLITAGDPPLRWILTTPTRWLLLALSMAVDTFTGVILLFNTQPVTMMAVPGLSVNRLSDTATGGALMWVGGDSLMALVMIFLAWRWLRSPAMRSRDRSGFLEQARRSTFVSNTGAEALESEAARFDDDDAKWRSYNEWLARINAGGH
jgi:putative copper resistance protein D